MNHRAQTWTVSKNRALSLFITAAVIGLFGCASSPPVTYALSPAADLRQPAALVLNLRQNSPDAQTELFARRLAAQLPQAGVTLLRDPAGSTSAASVWSLTVDIRMIYDQDAIAYQENGRTFYAKRAAVELTIDLKDATGQQVIRLPIGVPALIKNVDRRGYSHVETPPVLAERAADLVRRVVQASWQPPVQVRKSRWISVYDPGLGMLLEQDQGNGTQLEGTMLTIERLAPRRLKLAATPGSRELSGEIAISDINDKLHFFPARGHLVGRLLVGEFALRSPFHPGVVNLMFVHSSE